MALRIKKNNNGNSKAYDLLLLGLGNRVTDEANLFLDH